VARQRLADRAPLPVTAFVVAFLFCDLKLNRTAGLVLDDRRPVFHTAARGYVIDPKADEIATAQLAINGEVEHRQITLATLNLKPDTNGPHLFRPKGGASQRGGLCSMRRAKRCWA
jgi:hypothetical protein